MEKRIDKKYIYKILKDISYEQIYDSLQKILGEDGRVFAKYRVGHGDYQWEDRSQNWVCIKDLPQSDQDNALRFAKIKLGEIEQSISINKSFERIAPSIVSVPSNEEYIYCAKDSNGDFQILITGWGYKYPDRKPTGGLGDGVKVRKQQNVILVFTENEKPVSGVNILFNKNVIKSTDLNGKIILGPADEGSLYPIEVRAYDYKSEFVVKRGQEEYIFDMTTYIRAHIIVKKDNVPLSGTLCQLEFNGKHIEVTTDANGVAEVEIPYYEGVACKAKVANKSQTKNINGKIDLEYIFSLQSDVFPSIKVIDENNMIVPNYQVTIQWQNNKETFVSDDNGLIYLPEMTVGTEIICSDNQNRQIFETATENNEHLFKVDNGEVIPVEDEDVVEDTIEDDLIEAHLHVVRSEEPLINYPIDLIHNGVRKSYTTDGNGNIRLDNYVVNDYFQAIDGSNQNNKENYTVIDGVREYIFEILTPEEEQVITDIIETDNESWWSKSLWFTLLLLFAIGYFVLLNLI